MASPPEYVLRWPMWGSPDGYGSISRTYWDERSSGSFETSQVCSSAHTRCHLGSICLGSYRSTAGRPEVTVAASGSPRVRAPSLGGHRVHPRGRGRLPAAPTPRLAGDQADLVA